ncbi:MAG: glycosyltransferase family 2 protein [Terriglobia bacterium]
MSSKPLVSAVVVNWNGAEDLEICLPSLLAQSYRPMEIIVVDNASTDNSAAVTGRFGVRWLGLDQNRGPTGGMNEGAKSAQGEFVLFLNNDMRFHERFVEAMVSEIVRDPEVFSVDAYQYDWEGTKRIHLATYLARKGSEEYDYQFVPGLYLCQEPRVTPGPALASSNANMLARRTMFLELGGFDERPVIGGEDLELCWRAWVCGWRSVFAPDAVCWHRVGRSARSTEGSRIRFRGTLAGRLLTATKLLPVKFVFATWVVTLGGLARDLALLRWQRTRDRISVCRWYARNLPALLHDRRELYRSQHTSPQQQLERFLRLGRG